MLTTGTTGQACSDAELQPNSQSTRAGEVKNRLVGILNVLQPQL